MTYLTAYRSGSRKYGNESRRDKAFKFPDPYKPPVKPGFANDNIPKPANDNRVIPPHIPGGISRKGMRIISKVHPWLRAIDYATWLMDLARQNQSDLGGATKPDPAQNGWILERDCGEPATHIDGWIRSNIQCSSPWGTTVCFSGSLGVNPVGLGEPTPTNTIKVRTVSQSGTYGTTGQPLFNAAQYWYRAPGTCSPKLPFPQRRTQPRTRPRMPVLDPFKLPIQWFGPEPLPIPTALVPYRTNDPVGSQRNNGDRKHRWAPRRPPPKDEKEKKGKTLVRIAQLAVHAVGEGLDVLDAIHDALPKTVQAKAVFKGGKWWNATPQAKAQALYQNFDQLDLNEAIVNLIVNHYVDQLVGKSSAKAKQFLDTAPGGRIVGGVAIFG